MKPYINLEISDLMLRDPHAPHFGNDLLILQIQPSIKKEKNRVRIHALSLVVMCAGSLKIEINHKFYHLQGKAFLDVMDLHEVASIETSPDFRAYQVVVDRHFLDDCMRNVKRIPLASFLARCEDPVMELNDEEGSLLENCIHQLLRNIDRKEHLFHQEIVKIEVRRLFTEILNLIAQKDDNGEPSVFRSNDELVAQFLHLVRKHGKEEHYVSFYAMQLRVEAKYLSRLLKATIGKTAHQMINENLLSEAILLLKENDIQLSEIADRLHFSDSSAFGKFIKKELLCTPLQYRRKHIWQ